MTILNVFRQKIPQGSVLGPLLFLFYISDLSVVCLTPNVTLKFFADDLKAYIVYQHQADTNYLQAFINKLSAWCLENGLSIATEKCSALYIGRGNKTKKYYIDGNEIGTADKSVKDLGIHINKELKWNIHIDIITKSARSRLFCLFKALRSCDPKFLTKMYIAYVRPLVEYSSSIFNPYTKQEIKKLERIQITACRMIYYRCLQSKYKYTRPKYKKLIHDLGLETLQVRRLKADLIFFHKILLGEISLNCFSAPKLNTSRTRGNAFKINTFFSTKNVRYNFFLVKTARIYHSLPCVCTIAHNSRIFKKRISKLDFSKYLIDI